MTKAEAIELLAEVANESPTGTDSYEDPCCWFCGVEMGEGYSDLDHSADCLWGRIRRALDMDVPPARTRRVEHPA